MVMSKRMELLARAAGVLCSPRIERMEVCVFALINGSGFGANITGFGRDPSVIGATADAALERLIDATRASILSEKEDHPVHSAAEYDAALSMLGST